MVTEENPTPKRRTIRKRKIVSGPDNNIVSPLLLVLNPAVPEYTTSTTSRTTTTTTAAKRRNPNKTQKKATKNVILNRASVIGRQKCY